MRLFRFVVTFLALGAVLAGCSSPPTRTVSGGSTESEARAPASGTDSPRAFGATLSDFLRKHRCGASELCEVPDDSAIFGQIQAHHRSSPGRTEMLERYRQSLLDLPEKLKLLATESEDPDSNYSRFYRDAAEQVAKVFSIKALDAKIRLVGENSPILATLRDLQTEVMKATAEQTDGEAGKVNTGTVQAYGKAYEELQSYERQLEEVRDFAEDAYGSVRISFREAIAFDPKCGMGVPTEADLTSTETGASRRDGISLLLDWKLMRLLLDGNRYASRKLTVRCPTARNPKMFYNEATHTLEVQRDWKDGALARDPGSIVRFLRSQVK